MLQKTDLKLVKFNPEKHLPANLSEQVNDLLFILYLLAVGLNKNIEVSVINLTKTLFKLKLDWAKEGVDFLITDFYPFKLGPFNKEIYKYIDILDKGGFISQSGYNLSLKAKSLELYDAAKDYLATKHPEYAKKLEELAGYYIERYLSSSKAIGDTHKLRVQNEKGEVVSVDDLSKEEWLNKNDQGALYFEPNYDFKNSLRMPDYLVNKFIDIEDEPGNLQFNSLEELIIGGRTG